MLDCTTSLARLASLPPSPPPLHAFANYSRCNLLQHSLLFCFLIIFHETYLTVPVDDLQAMA